MRAAASLALVWIRTAKKEAKWKRFHPFRVVRKIFRRRIKREGTSVGTDTSKKSWSTSELQSVQIESEGKSEVTSSLKIGLSVSHDSIFSPESGVNPINSDEINVARESSLSVRHASIKNMFKDELFTKIRSRRDSDDDDIGLPHSPCTSPTTADVLAQGLKDKTPKCQTACSVGSLISMGSSENEEDSAGHSSGHSSRMSLLEKRSLDSEGELDLNQPIPLNHNAAHHKIAVRPKRTYGLPRRRKNQIATSKMNALPSTPEVTEDNGKTFQSLEKFETLKLTSETICSSYVESRTAFSDATEAHVSGLATSTSLGALSNILYETQMSQMKQLSLSENSKMLETYDTIQQKEIDLRKQYLSVSEKKQDKNNFNLTSGQEFSHNISEYKTKINESFEETNISNSLKELVHSSLEQSSEYSRNEERIEFVKNSQEDENKILNEFSESILKTPESPLSVSSLVKNINNCSPNNDPQKFNDEIEDITPYNISGEQSDIKMNHFTTEENINSLPIVSQNSTQKNYDMDIKFEDKHLSDDLKLFKLSQECLSQITPKTHGVTEKLNIDSEFILKPLKKDVKLSPESNALHKEKPNEKEDENSLISLSLKNENKLEDEIKLSDIKENRIFISHHSSLNQDLKDILVTEAHNYTALKEHNDIALISSHEKTHNLKKEKSNDPWVSSVDISTSKAVQDVTINSSTSTICDNQCFEDKVTISINSISENANAKSSDLNKTNEALKHSYLEVNNKIPLLKSDTDSKEKLIPKQIQKSHLPDANLSHPKANAQKRLSVEIVPFSQRMKERKYQPITFNNKDTVLDNDKKHVNSLVERKLSDRKLINKNKDLDKTNNRHSFSGTLVSEKKEEGKTIIEKKIVKSEKMQYPIQFRIHKNIPKFEAKEKSFNDPTLKENKTINSKEDVSNNKVAHPSLKTANNDLKFPFKGDGKQINDNSSKWEIKIQTAVQNNEFKNTSSDQEISESLSFHKNNDSQAKDSCTSNPERSISALDDIEKSVKNLENGSKPLKDIPVISDEPEPELFRVFARRSIKQKHSDKIEKNNSPLDENSLHIEKSENEIDSMTIAQNGTIIKITDASKSHNDKSDMIKIKSKSFCEKEKPNSISLSPLKEINSFYKESQTKVTSSDNITENVNLHQRFVNVPDHLVDSDEKAIKNIQNDSNLDNSFNEEHLHRESSLSTPPFLASVNGNLSNAGNVKENQEMFSSKETHTPSWLQLAQQRRELREQRERLLLGGSSNSYLDASNKPSRSSKVWDMVNNFQKLQMT